MNSIVRNRSSFAIQNGKTEIASVKYNHQNNSMRIYSAERRLFFLNSVGLLQNKILLNTEYGVTIGEVYPIKNHRKGVLHIGEHKFNYIIEQNMLHLQDKRRKPLISFSFTDTETTSSHEAATIVFTLAWLYVHANLSEATARKASALYVS